MAKSSPMSLSPSYLNRHWPTANLPKRLRPSLCNSKVGSCNCFFGACSAFTHVMACTLAESPSDPLHRELRQLCCLRCRLDCYRVERTSSRAGVAPAVVQRLSRRTISPVEENIAPPRPTIRWLDAPSPPTRIPQNALTSNLQ